MGGQSIGMLVSWHPAVGRRIGWLAGSLLDGWTDKPADGKVDMLEDERLARWVNGSTDGQAHGRWVGEWFGGWTDR